MTTLDFDKTKKELEENIIKNNQTINVCDSRQRLVSINQIDSKIFNIFAFSMFPYFGSILAGSFLSKSVDITAITNIIPGYNIPLVMLAGSLGIGTLINKAINKKYKTKERFKSFSKSKTESQKISEEINNQIEKEKAQNRNKILQKTLETLESNHSLLSSLSNKYDITERNTPKNQIEATNKLKELNKILEQKYNELDILTTKRILSERFIRIRSKSQKVMDIIMVTALSGFLALIITILPFIAMNNILEAYSTIVKDIIFFTPLIGGVLIANTYLIIRTKNLEQAFNNLNSKLGKNALPKIDVFDYERSALDSLITRSINDISVIEMKLKETKRVLERITSETTEEKTTKKEKTWDDVLYTEEEIHQYMQMPDCQAPFNPEMIFASNEPTKEEYELKGPRLVRKRK